MPPRPCLTPGCPNMARGGARGPRCTPCQRGVDAARNRHPSRQAYRDPTYQAYQVQGQVCALQIPGVCTHWATTRDHIIPISRGGTNDWSNLQPACAECNASKRDGDAP